MHYNDVLSSVKTHGKTSPRKQLGNAIRERRLRMEVSQEKLAELANVHRNYVGKVERGEQNITIDSLVRFADTFRCRPSELLDEAGL